MTVSAILRFGTLERIASGSYVPEGRNRGTIELTDGSESLSFRINIGSRMGNAPEIKLNKIDEKTLEVVFYALHGSRSSALKRTKIAEFNDCPLFIEVSVTNLADNANVSWLAADARYEIAYAFWLDRGQNG